MLTPGGARRSGLSRGEKEWEPSGMFAREKALAWFRSWTECERDKAGKPINVLPCFLKKTSLGYSQRRISWHHRIFSPGKFMNPLKFSSIQARWDYQPLLFSTPNTIPPEEITISSHHNSYNSFLFHYAALNMVYITEIPLCFRVPYSAPAA